MMACLGFMLWITTFPFGHIFEEELGGTEIKGHPATKGNVVIGNDVWIGHNAIIVGEVNVGNGAIIAAGSVVTKDIPPFSIVAGVPAKVIKKRFSNDIINEIEFLKWWDFSKEELIQIKNLFFKDLNKINSIYDDYNS